MFDHSDLARHRHVPLLVSPFGYSTYRGSYRRAARNGYDPLMLALLAASASFAATLVVDSSGAAGTYDTITEAITAASAGDTIEVGAGSWYECLVVNKGLSLVGTGGSGTTEIGGGGYCSAAVTVSASGVRIEGFTVSNPGEQAMLASGSTLELVDVVVDGAGSSDIAVGGALAFSGDSLSVENSEFTNNEAEACGAISLEGDAAAVFTDVVLDSNVADTGRGGALCVGSGGSVELYGVEFTDNDAEGAGAMVVAAGADVTGTDTTWRGNHADDHEDEAGAILILANASVDLADATFTANGSTASSSGVNGDSISLTEAGASLLLSDVTFSAPDTYGYAGQIFLENGNEARITRGTFTNSYHSIYATTGSTVTTVDCAFSAAYHYELVLWGTYVDEGSEFSDTQVGLNMRGDAELTGSWFHDLTEQAITVPEGSLALSGILIEDSYGVLVTDATGPITVEDSTFLRTAGGEGGAVGVETGDLTVRNSEADESDASYGGAFYAKFGDLTLDGVTVTNSTASEGGAAGVGGYPGQTLDVRDSWFEGNVATRGSGALKATGEFTEVVDSVFIDNTTTGSGRGGAISAGDTSVVAVSGSVFCGNTAYDGGAVATYRNESLTVENSVFSENAASNDGGALWVYESAGDFTNSTFAGNDASGDGGGLYFHESSGSLTNNIVAYTVAGDGLYGDANSGDDVVVTYTDWYANTSADRTGGFVFPTAGFGNTTDDPGFIAVNIDGNCWNDNWKLHPRSALIDAGDPSVEDADGTVSDMGATGGSGARWADDDGDDWLWPFDCDDGDSTVNGGATEIAYDGVDDDCDGADLTDVDGDGHDATLVGGDDCNDDDATIHPSARETKDDGIDQDCDGEDSVTEGDDTAEDTGVPADSGDSGNPVDSADTEDSADSPDSAAETGDPEDTAGTKPEGCSGAPESGGCAGGLGVGLWVLLAAGMRRRAAAAQRRPATR